MERGPLNLLVIFILVVKVTDGQIKNDFLFGALKYERPRRTGDHSNENKDLSGLLLSTKFVWRRS